MNSIFLNTFFFIFLFTSLSANETFATQSVPPRKQNVCRSYFGVTDLWKDLDSEDMHAFQAAVVAFASLENKTDSQSFQIRHEIQTQLTHFQNNKNYTPQQRADFYVLFRNSVRQQIALHAKARFKDGQIQIQQKKDKTQQSESALEEFKILAQILSKYEAKNVDEALINSCSNRNKRGRPSKITELEDLKFLLRFGADVNYVNPITQESALYTAVSSNSLEAVRILIEAGAFVDIPNTKSMIPALSLASQLGYSKIVDLLLQSHATVDLQDLNGYTPLMYATRHTSFMQVSNDTTVELLLNAKANVELKNTNEETALFLAAANGKAQILNLLIRANAQKETHDKKETTPLHAAASNGQNETFEILLAEGANVHATDRSKWTVLMSAIMGKINIKNIRLLLEKGININAQDKWDGMSALMHAIQLRRVDIVTLLLDANADVFLKTKADPDLNREGKTALMLASEARTSEIGNLIDAHISKRRIRP